MPIQAAANKLKDEILRYGLPPVFPNEDDEQVEEGEEKSVEAAMAAKSKGKKTKLLQKGMAGAVAKVSNLSFVTNLA